MSHTPFLICSVLLQYPLPLNAHCGLCYSWWNSGLTISSQWSLLTVPWVHKYFYGFNQIQTNISTLIFILIILILLQWTPLNLFYALKWLDMRDHIICYNFTFLIIKSVGQFTSLFIFLALLNQLFIVFIITWQAFLSKDKQYSFTVTITSKHVISVTY